MTEVFELTYHGGGGFTYSEVWNMPVPHRKFSLKKIEEFLNKVEEKRNESKQVVTENTNMSKFQMPDAVKKAMEKGPTFVSKAKSKN